MSTRRDFIKKAAYAAPVILTLNARPSFAGHGSKRDTDDGDKYSENSTSSWLAWFYSLFGR